MKADRRSFLRFGAMAAVAAGVARRSDAAGELNNVRGKTYIAACPPVREYFEPSMGD